MKVGDYVRTKKGTFDRFITSHTQDDLTWYTFEDRGNITNPENYIIKSSPNIIDLIEVGDYINGFPVLHKENNELVCGLLLRYKEENIQNVVTKEQFESMEYKVGEK